MKCPSCGFETPDAQGWCDFCKEPFRRAQKKDAPAPAETAPASAAPAPAAPAPVPAKPSIAPVSETKPAPEGAAKPAASAEGAAPKLTPEQAFELLRLDPGERIPAVSPALRYGAYGFLLVCLLWAAAMTMVLMNRAQRMQTSPPPAASSEEPPPEPIPADGEAAPQVSDPAMTR